MKPNQLGRRLEALGMNLTFNERIVLHMPDGSTESLPGNDQAVCSEELYVTSAPRSWN